MIEPAAAMVVLYIYGGEGSGNNDMIDLGGNVEMYGGVAASASGG